MELVTLYVSKLNSRDGRQQAESSALKDRKIVWLIHQGTPICAALDRLRPVNAAEALAYQHLKDEKGLGATQGRQIGFVDISRPLDDVEEGEEDNSEYEMESHTNSRRR